MLNTMWNLRIIIVILILTVNLLFSQTKLTGHIKRITGDRADGAHVTWHILEADTKQYQIVNSDLISDDILNKNVQVSATIDKNKLILNSVKSISEKNRVTSTENPRPSMKILVLFFNYLDSPEKVIDIEFLRNGPMKPGNKIEKLFKTVSYGKQTAAFVDFYQYNFNRKELHSDQWSDFWVTKEELINIFTELKIDPTKYNTLLYMQNGNLGGLMGVASTGTLELKINGTSYFYGECFTKATFIKEGWLYSNNELIHNGIRLYPFGDYFLGTGEHFTAHELAHTLGLYHSNGYDPKISGNNSPIPYGNRFDLLGSGTYCNNINALFKEKLNWLDDSSILKIRESGVYSMKALGLKNGVRAAKIKAFSDYDYGVYLEYRNASGIDSTLKLLPKNTEGLFINVTDKFLNYGWNGNANLIDAAPQDSASTNWDVVALNGNNTYSFANKEVTIGPIISFDDSTITFKVDVKLYAPYKARIDASLAGNNKIKFLWSKPINAETYKLQISTDNNFSSLVYDSTLVDTQKVVQRQWNSSTLYYARVLSQNSVGSTPSDAYLLDLHLTAPSLKRVDYTQDGTWPFEIPVFRWNEDGFTESTLLEVSMDSDFSTILFSKIFTGDSIETLNTNGIREARIGKKDDYLAYPIDGKFYHHRIKRKNQFSESQYSNSVIWVYRCKQPELNMPEIVSGNKVKVSWKNMSLRGTYFTIWRGRSKDKPDSMHNTWDNSFTQITSDLQLQGESYIDNNVEGDYWYWYLVDCFTSGRINSMWDKYLIKDVPIIYVPLVSSVKDNNLPKEFSMTQNYPNPFNPTTTIKYEIPKSSFVTLQVYDVLGREITKLLNEQKQPGYYEVKFDGSNLASGVYLYKITAGSFVDTKKFILMK